MKPANKPFLFAGNQVAVEMVRQYAIYGAECQMMRLPEEETMSFEQYQEYILKLMENEEAQHRKPLPVVP